MQHAPVSPHEPPVPAGALGVHLLGVVEFDAATLLQDHLIYELSGRDDRSGALLLCEHPPLITIGREGSRAHVLADEHELTARQLPVRRLGRGGGTFIHAPGQLAVYPLVPLERLGIGPLEFRRRLEEAVVDVCEEFQVPAECTRHSPGVFGRVGQVAHVGVAVKSGVTSHGLFLNVHCDPAWFGLIRPDRSGLRTTTLAAQRTRVTEMAPVREAVIRHVAARLGYAKWHTFTGHPLLVRTTRTVRRHA